MCLCDDCQAYVHWLGRANENLDQNGGTEVFSVAPAHLQITGGFENLNCVRLSQKGMYRWYAGCCKSPVANSMPPPKIPFAGVHRAIFDFGGDERKRGEVMGPIRAKVQGKFGIGPLPPDVFRSTPIGLILRTIGFLLVGAFKKQHRPSPFFDDKGEPKVQPYVLEKNERENLRNYCGPKDLNTAQVF